MGKLSREERELLHSFERGEWRSVPNLKAEKKKFQKAAGATRRNRRITVELSARDAHLLLARAERKGISHQKLISNLIHKYLSGRSIGPKTKSS
jgi:predicted DNA binding CopG/RHH family protein